MYRVRLWSARNSRWLVHVYDALEKTLIALYPLLSRMGHERLDRFLMLLEKPVKGLLFDSQSCGQCTLTSTGMSCPMNCPKTLRNGPCGGVRADGGCEVKPEMLCVWVSAWEGSRHMREGEQAIQIIQSPVDNRLRGSSSWLRAAKQRLSKNDAV
ncbi:MAG: methylenetetrahydrofolate reductase C-terminal domain-containing protein [Halioglobus sp.]